MYQAHNWTIRDVDRAADAAAICGLGTSYTTESIYEMTGDKDSLRLARAAAPSRLGRFPIDLDQPQWERGFVTVDEGRVRGFIATQLEAWNRRLTIWHFYVDRDHRRQGIGRALMEHAIDTGQRSGALTAWAP